MSSIGVALRAVEGGWALGCDLPLEVTYFRSGAQAEVAARRVAIHLSEAGHDVTLRVTDRSELPVAIHRYYAL